MLSLSRPAIGASLLLMTAAPFAALAHGGHSAVRVVLDGVEPSAAGLRVQVYDDHLAPQLVLENASGAPLEILDEHGRAFLRIEPGGVEADLAAAAWYDTLSPGGAAGPAAARAAGTPPAWWRVRAQPSWGWFDRRLDRDALALPPVAIADPVVLGHWRVPARLGERPLEIRGHFLYQPHPAGQFVARLAAGELAEKVRVALVPGQPPALLLENEAAVPVVVLGAHGEPFLRIGAGGVEANLASPTWQDLGRYRGLEVAPSADGTAARWTRISLAPRYSWLEPRAAMPSVGMAVRPDNTRSKVKGWEVPVLVGERRAAIRGVVEWVPYVESVRLGSGLAH